MPVVEAPRDRDEWFSGPLGTDSSPAVAARRRTARRVGVFLAAVAGLVGVVALVGWAWPSPVLASWIPGHVSMKLNSAAACVAVAAALLLLSVPPRPGVARGVGAALATFALGVAALTLAEWALGWNAGIDEALVPDVSGAVGTGAPGRMAPQTAVAFVLTSGALLARAAGARRAAAVEGAAALAVGVGALVALSGYLVDLPPFYGIAPYTRVAVPSAVAFLALSAALVATRPGEGFMAVATAETAGGEVARRLLPVAVAIPLVLGALRTLGARAGLYPTDVGRLVYMVAVTLGFGLVVARTVLVLHRTDLARLATVARLEEASLRFRRLFEDAPVGMALVGPDLRLERGNAVLAGYLGRSTDELRGLPLEELLEPGAGVLEAVARALRGEGAAFRAECRLVGRDGRFRWVDLAVSVVRDRRGCLLCGLAVGNDVTARKRAEAALVGQRDRLQAMGRDLQAANEELEAFAASASHDLRAPLRGIEAYAEVLEEDHGGCLGFEGLDTVRRVRREARRMRELVDDLLRLSRPAAGPLRREPLDLSALARAAVDGLRSRDPGRRVRVTVEDDLRAEGDASLVRSVLENLLGNAWKYTAETADPRIEVGRVKGEASCFFVRDNGVGFDPAHSDHLFQPFARLSTGERFPGTGVGLAIVQRIVVRHGGRVWAEGHPGEGAAFFFTLPPAGSTPI